MSVDWAEASKEARKTDRMAETLCKALAKRHAKRWQFVSFRGQKKGEWRGVVDLIAIRKDTSQPQSLIIKRGDLFDIILIQVKGGAAAKPTQEDISRLCSVARRYRAKEIVKYRWLNQKKSIFSVLKPKGVWEVASAKDIFG